MPGLHECAITELGAKFMADTPGFDDRALIQNSVDDAVEACPLGRVEGRVESCPFSGLCRERDAVLDAGRAALGSYPHHLDPNSLQTA